MCELFEETEENLKLPEDSRYEDLEKKIQVSSNALQADI